MDVSTAKTSFMTYMIMKSMNLLCHKLINLHSLRSITAGKIHTLYEYFLVSLSHCLTHCGTIMPYGGRDLGKHWPDDTKRLSWSILTFLLWCSPKSSFTVSIQPAMLCNVFGNHNYTPASTKLKGVYIGFIMSVCPSVRPPVYTSVGEIVSALYLEQ